LQRLKGISEDIARLQFSPDSRRLLVLSDDGVERVPALHAEVEKRLTEMSAGRAPTATLGQDSQAEVVSFATGSNPTNPTDGTSSIRVSGEAPKTQQPSLFDFARRRPDAVLAKAQ
jgi:hypothetical protein